MRKNIPSTLKRYAQNMGFSAKTIRFYFEQDCYDERVT